MMLWSLASHFKKNEDDDSYQTLYVKKIQMYQGHPYKKCIQIEKDKLCKFLKNLGVEKTF